MRLLEIFMESEGQHLSGTFSLAHQSHNYASFTLDRDKYLCVIHFPSDTAVRD